MTDHRVTFGVDEQPLYRSGMSSTLTELQDLTGFRIRDDYEALVTTFPSQLLNRRRADDGSDREGLVNTVELMSELADVLDINLEVRFGSVVHPDGHDFHWPDQILVIGDETDEFAFDSGMYVLGI